MPAQTYRRIDLALEQLDVALMLFLERGDFPAVITLAGAAEEVLGKEVNRRGWQVALHRRVNRYAEQDRKAAITEQNRVRNALKHFADHEQSEFTADLEEAARWALERACENAHRLELEVPRSEAFGEWYQKTLIERHAAHSGTSPT
ncbi:hypothetical protein DP62_5739 [Burkholderia pseudomallei]|uniref:hypothetical protein n=1 Tax=Burkholderia pseudomallei TaxID=28450 RepID=UPI00050E3A5D|nr:hypothetical protein [Burkholderia pseudomallei]KGC96404.1 hypothetical protein DP62_5739 [Burkholderia pseudomallei]